MPLPDEQVGSPQEEKVRTDTMVPQARQPRLREARPAPGNALDPFSLDMLEGISPRSEVRGTVLLIGLLQHSGRIMATIAVLSGDGIGPEVTREAVKVLQARWDLRRCLESRHRSRPRS